MSVPFATLLRKLASASEVATDVGAAAAGEVAGRGVGQLVTRAASHAARAAPVIGSVAGEVIGYATQRASGQNPPAAKALMSGLGGFAGGLAGGAVGTATAGPVGGVGFGTAGSYVGNRLGEALYDGATGIARDTAAAVKNVTPLPQRMRQDPVPTRPAPTVTFNRTPGLAPGVMAPNPTVAYVPPAAAGASDFARRVQARAAAMNRAGPVGPPAPPASVPQPVVGGARLPPFTSPTVRGPR